jgi:uncharacterized protein YciI
MWFIGIRRAVQPREQWTVTVDEHLAWMQKQHQSGAIVMSGPGVTADGRVGIYLIRAATRAEAERVAAGDPFTVAGHCTFDLIEWDVHQIMGAGPFTAGGLNAPGSR